MSESIKEVKKEEELNGVFTYELKKPVIYNGENITELSFDFERLTGGDSLKIEDELQALGKTAVVPALNSEYLIRMAAMACTKKGIGADLFPILGIADFTKITSKAKNFLLKSE